MLWFWFCFFVTLHIFSQGTVKQKRAQTKCPKSHKQGAQKAFYYSVYLLILYSFSSDWSHKTNIEC